MRVRVLGSAAGGGFPQWNCGCANCRGLRSGTLRAAARTQESVAISADGAWWFLLNVSPDIRQQIEAFPRLWPRGSRGTPIAGIFFNNGDLDHCLGLFVLRESQPLMLYATEPMRSGLVQGNVIFRTLQRFPEHTLWHTLVPHVESGLRLPDGTDSGLTVTAVPLPGKLPLHLEGLRSASPEDNVALVFREIATGKRLAYASAVGGPSPALESLLDADALFFDGTFWTSDELITAGLGFRRAEEMAHWPVSGEGGSLQMLARVRASRKVLIHINNTNPLLADDSPERRAVEAAGVEIAYDGMELDL